MLDLTLIEGEIRALETEATDYATCERLACLYTVRDHLKQPIKSGGSEFLKACNGKDVREVLAIIDELMEVTAVLHPAAYREIMGKLKEAP